MAYQLQESYVSDVARILLLYLLFCKIGLGNKRVQDIVPYFSFSIEQSSVCYFYPFWGETTCG